MLTTILVLVAALVISAAYNRQPKSDVVGHGCDAEGTQFDILRSGRRVVRHSSTRQIGSEL